MNKEILDIAERIQRDKEAINLHKIEGYTFTDEQNEMFKMFDREGYTDEQRRAYIIAKAKEQNQILDAAE